MADQPAAPTPSTSGAPDATQPGFAIERIYIKDLSVEDPGAPQ